MDIQERVEVAILYKYYGKMLTEKQQNIITMYVDNNLSLAEVSEELGISRQAVKDAIDNAVSTLKNMEEKLAFVTRDNELKNIINNSKIDEKIKMQLIVKLED